ENIKRVFDLLAHNKEVYKDLEVLGAKSKGEWTKYYSEDIAKVADHVSKGLIKQGVKRDDKVAIMAENRPEWNFCDFGIMQTGAVQVPMYPTLAENDIRFILKDAEIKLIFVSTGELYHKLKNILQSLDLEISLYTFDYVDGAKH